MVSVAADNDLLLKAACYILLAEIVSILADQPNRCGILGAATFVCSNALKRRGLEDSLRVFTALAGQCTRLEPTAEELTLAAQVELDAQQRGLELDAGESLLFAIVQKREISRLATGDKRAIRAIEEIVLYRQIEPIWNGKILCLEQIILRVIEAYDPELIRKRICAASFADRAMAICFSCSSGGGNVEDWRAGLESYVANLRRGAMTVLAC